MNQLIKQPTQEITILPRRQPLFSYENDGRGLTVSLKMVASAAQALCRRATGEEREGIIALAIALGITVEE